jgi:hypothetical protein
LNQLRRIQNSKIANMGVDCSVNTIHTVREDYSRMRDLELIGLYEIAKLAGVSPPAVANWRTRFDDFPKPLVDLKSGPVFRKLDVQQWLNRRKGEGNVGNDATRIGLRLLELESGIASNIDDQNSAELVDYEVSRATGQSARLAMLIRGQDVIEDETRLKKIAAIELGIHPAEYTVAKRLLMDADLIEERTTKSGKSVINEKVNRLNHADNYRRIGDLWLAGDDKTHKEEALIYTFDEVVQSPQEIAKIGAIRDLNRTDRNAVIELAINAGIWDSVDEAKRVYYSPLLWDVNRSKLAAFLQTANDTSFGEVLRKMKRPGTDLTRTRDPLMIQAISGGILPSYRVNSTGGERLYSFAPYSGGMLSSDSERTILDKARALVSCLRYGSEAATITKIRNPLWILNALMDPSRSHRLNPHSELKLQYGMLVAKQLGRVISTNNGRFMFELIPTEDNLRASAIAKELLSVGEIMGAKDPEADAALHLVSGTIEQPLREVNIARKKRPARSDELADLVERLQSV